MYVRIPLAVIGLTDPDIESAVSVLRSGNLTMGRQVREFEKRMAEYLDVSHFIMVNSGSSANLILIESLLRPSKGKPRLNSGDGVLVPAIAWPTTVWPIVQLGLVPVFVDVKKDTFDIDLDAASTRLNSAKFPVRGIFPIHPLGFGINHEELDAFAKKYDLVHVSDVCESLGSWNKNKHAGTTGLASTFSFYFSHHITTMEGGGIATNDLVLADDLRSMRSHGWSRDRSDSDYWTSNLNPSDAKFRFITTGYNLRPTEVQAAIGLNQIARIDEFVRMRRSIVKRVSQACIGGPFRVIGERYLEGDSASSHSWMLIPLALTSASLSRANAIEYFESKGIETRPVLTGNFLRQPALELLDLDEDAESFPITDWITQNCFVIGCHHDFTAPQVDYIVQALNQLKD